MIRGNAYLMKQKIALSAKKKILFLPHAIKQMSRPDKMITTAHIKEAVTLGEIIESYPRDKRGASCLVSYVKKNKPLHVVCAPKNEYLAIITAYSPTTDKWSSDYKTRK
jgi:hypothetical protein